MTALLTDEAIWSEAEEFTVNPISTDSFRQGFRIGAGFARSIYEARLAEDAKVRAQLVDELKKAQILLRLLTVQQVIESGGPFIEASGLNPWCLNEGLSTGNERLSTWQIDAALAAAKVLE